MNPSLSRLSAFETNLFTNFKEIVCLIADGNYSLIYLKDGRVVVVSKCLLHVEQLLPKAAFIRIHRRYLISLNFVVCVRIDKQIKLANGNLYTISRRKWRQIQLHFKKK